MALLSTKVLAAWGWVILNVLRAMNIVTLLAVIAASAVMIVKTVIYNNFFFFDAVNHVITCVISMFLIISECSLFRGYFARNWPLLSPTHGFVALGVAIIVLGLNVLGNMNKEATSQKNLGNDFWRLVLAAGILAVIIGNFNIIASYIFRDSANGMSARRVRAHGADRPPYFDDPEDPKAMTINTHITGSSNSSNSKQCTFSPVKSRLTQYSPARAFRNARQSILPSYHSSSPLRAFRSSSHYSRSESGSPTKKSKRESVPRIPLNISAPMNVNPNFAHLVKPDLAHHPSQRRPEEDGSGTPI